jgi:hypothetical protein
MSVMGFFANDLPSSGSFHIRRLVWAGSSSGTADADMEFLGGLMSIRNLFSLLLIVAASFTLSARAFAQGEWAAAEVGKTPR